MTALARKRPGLTGSSRGKFDGSKWVTDCRLSALVVLVVSSTGCSTYAAARYSISAENVRTLRTFKGQTVNVTAAKPGQTEITCRGVGLIKTPDGEPFEQFIRKAFVDEMTIAELYAPDAPVSLTRRLDSIDFSSGIG